MTRLDLAELTRRFLGSRRSRFRLETLPAYAVTTDGDDFNRWLRGEREPDWARKQAWLDTLRAEVDAKKMNTRVRVLSEHLTEYERFSCAWGYEPHSAAGENIRVIRRGEHPIPVELAARHLLPLIEQDWWLIDDTDVIVMHYDRQGRFDHAEALSRGAVGVYRDVQRLMWNAAEPFGDWWARHPELHRKVAA